MSGDMICCFCGQPVLERDLHPLSMALTGARSSDGAVQGLTAHGGCLAQALHPSVPFDPEIFED